ncbi:MAG: FAD binding domain-containing protein [Actinomycetota bacterium]
MPVAIPTSLEKALSLLALRPDSVVLAGGTDLMVEVNSGHRQVGSVIAIDRVAELRTWGVDGDRRNLWIGSGVPYSTVMQDGIATLVPALAQASRTVGSPQIRHVGTIGGNLGTCSPAGDTLPVLAALDARVHLASSSGERSVGFGEFMVGVKRTSRRPGELITGVTIPLLNGWQGYSKVGVRNAMVIATASSCLAVDTDTRSVRVALGSVGPVIIRCGEAEEWISGRVDWAALSVSDADADEFGLRCGAAARPIDDHRSTAAYRRRAVEVLAARQLRRAFPNG